MRYLLLIITLLLISCNATVPKVRPYKMEITQGNIVTSKMLAQLKPGMSKSQVKFIVGTPLIQDMFHKDRWDYFLQQIVDGKITEQRRVIIDFKDDKLINVGGDVIPIAKGDITDTNANVATGYKFIKEDPQVIAQNTKNVVAQAEKASWTDSLMFWKDNKTEADKAALKKQIEAHNQSLLDKDAEARVAADNSKPLNTTLPLEPVTAAPTMAAVDTNVDAKSMGKAPDTTTAKEEKSFWNSLKFWGKAAPAVAAPIAGAASVTPPLTPLPIVTITKAPEVADPLQTVDAAITPVEAKPAEVNMAQTPVIEMKAAEMTPAEAQPIVVAPAETVPTPAAIVIATPATTEPIAQEITAISNEQSNDRLRLSEQLNTYLDLPLDNPFTSSTPEPLGLQLTSLIAVTSQSIIELTNLETNNKNQQAETAAEKAKATPGFFERMLERVGF